MPQAQGWRRILSRRMLMCVCAGFSSGLPLYVLITLLSAFLIRGGVDIKFVGIMSLIMIPYTWKFLWAPLLDRFNPWHLGRRRGWMLLSQLLLIALIAAVGFLDPKRDLGLISTAALMIAFASASQDVSIDAWRRELLPDCELGLGNSFFVNAYRIASLIPGGLALILADILPWSLVFIFTALCMLPGVVLSLCIKERGDELAPRTLKEAVIEPFWEFITRRGWRAALICLSFVFFYKLGDSMATALATPFYLDLGYSLTAIGIIAKNVGLWSMVAGGFIGGIIMLKIGINKALWLFGLGQVVSILGFVWLAQAGQSGVPPTWLLALVIGLEALGAGLGTAAFVSYIARTTNPRFTATQFALLTSFAAIPRTLCNSVTGFIVEAVGWEDFFLICTLLALPGMLLLFKAAPWHAVEDRA